MIKLDKLQKSYSGFQLECSLEVKPGMITGLIGPNGVGKSTTFKSILGLISFDGGEVRVLGKNVKELTGQDRQKIGVALADSGFSGYLTIKGVIAILKQMYREFDKEKFEGLCKQFALPMDKQIKDFSTGMKARLKVLVAITHNASLLILDEPTAGLDVAAREDILDMLRSYMEEDENRSILISSHISSDLQGLCDDAYLMNRGKVVLYEDMNVLMNEYAILKVDEKQYDTMDKSYVLYRKKESFGYSCLVSERQFYQENYPQLVLEKSTLDDVILTVMKGEKV